jgi:hypothetical protein
MYLPTMKIFLSSGLIFANFLNVFALSFAFSLPAYSQPKVKLATKTDTQGKSQKIADWFQQYDLIRKNAQMSDTERFQSKRLLTEGAAASLFGQQSLEDKQAAARLLSKMVDRYQRACTAMNSLSQVNETKKLHKGYADYFASAGGLFADYLKIQGNLLARDASGTPIFAQLTQRKAALEQLDLTNKELDAKLRSKYSIAPFPY